MQVSLVDIELRVNQSDKCILSIIELRVNKKGKAILSNIELRLNQTIKVSCQILNSE